MTKISLNNIDKSKWISYPFEKIAKRISESVDPNKTDLAVYIGLEHLDAETVHIRRHGAPSDVSGGKLKCYPGDIIFGKRRAYQRKAGIVEQEGICSAHSFVFRANEDVISARLFPFFLHSDQFMHRMVDISVGGLSPTINWSDLKHQEFLLPPKDQQAKLADLLWAMDDVIEKDLKVLESLEVNKKSAIFIHFKSRQSKLVKNKSLLKLASKIKPDNIDKEQILSVKLHLNGIVKNDSVDGLKLGATQYFIRKKGQFIYGKQNLHNGAFGIIPEELDGFVSSSDIPSFDFINSEINPSYFYLYYSQFYIYKALEKLSTGTGSKRINENLFLEQFFPLITIKEQNIFLKLINHIDQNINLSNSKLASSKALQKSLINQIF